MAALKEKLANEPHITSLPHVDIHEHEFRKGVYKVTEGVFIAVGYALANSICVETKTGLVIIDTLEDVGAAREVCKEFKRLTNNKPIKSVIFTHAHFDHTAGIRGFIENEKEEPTIYLHEDCMRHESWNVSFKYGIGARSLRQFGTLLNHQVPHSKQKNWYKNAGIGASLNLASVLNEDREIIQEFEHSAAGLHLFKPFGESHSFYQDEIKFEMVAAFGETDNQILIHVPAKSLLCPGDNIYRSFPNLYAIRGVEPRNAYAWYKSIEKMLDYVQRHNIQHLAPSHSRHVVGYQNIMDVLMVYRDGISFVHDQTIRLLNQGYSQEEIVAEVQRTKPAKLFQHPYLLEYYGTIEWGVRAIFMKNMGWFSGKVDDLFPCSKRMKSAGMVELVQFMQNQASEANGPSVAEHMVKYIEMTNERKKADQLDTSKYTRDDVNRWLLELTTQVMMNEDSERVRELRYDIIRDMASYQTSGPARNYLLSWWLEEKYDLELKGSGNFSMKDIILSRPVEWTLVTLPFHVHPAKCREVMENSSGMITGVIELCDVKQVFRVRLKRIGVMQMTPLKDGYDVNDASIDWVLRTNEMTLKHILTDDKPRGDTQAQPEETGHMIPRVRTGSGGLISVLFGLIASKRSEKNGLVKGKRKAMQFFSCLETKVISKL
eukprot:CAMPEP_0197027746 /NCGR_PEP_ID=MMETSP1384-20130603/7619_1 /TAXON_ID=29189 /ORGANISM="Ammonia sp." /LENGTH=658 /DNA_ID=CAMNT_0042456645 /DNA_START=43 /DNA_END=2019 /DNA_ORIENTATION=-